MTLSDIKENQSAFITEINDGLPMKRRLIELGFVKNQRIVCDNISLYGSPMSFTICDTKLAIRKKDAELIGVIM